MIYSSNETSDFLNYLVIADNLVSCYKRVIND